MKSAMISVDTGNWCVEIDPDNQTGRFVNNHTGRRGNVWFEKGKLVDYDGMRNLPQEVVTVLRNAGYNLSYL